MNSRAKACLWVGAASIPILVLIVAHNWDDQPRFAGERLDYWLDHLEITLVLPGGSRVAMILPGPYYRTRAEANDALEVRRQTLATAEKAINRVGRKGMPRIMARLQTRDWSTLKVIAVRLGMRVRVIEPGRILSPDMKRGQALTALLRLRPDSEEVLSELAQIARRAPAPGAREAAWALRSLAPERWPSLTEVEDRGTNNFAGR